MKNESVSDRIIRGVIAVVLFSLGKFFFVGTLSIVAFVLAFVTLVTAITGFCALYKLLGINTDGGKK